MGIWTLIVLSVGLAMDACAVSIANGLCYRSKGGLSWLKAPIAFGIAQAVMPLVGYFAGSLFSETISFLDHWIALIVLSIIGIKMILDAVKELREYQPIVVDRCDLSNKILFAQSIATSIDAFTVGVSFAVIKVNILFAVTSIGVITFICCCAGILMGNKLGDMAKEKAQIFGGVVLIIIGVKTFIEHSL